MFYIVHTCIDPICYLQNILESHIRQLFVKKSKKVKSKKSDWKKIKRYIWYMHIDNTTNHTHTNYQHEHLDCLGPSYMSEPTLSVLPYSCLWVSCSTNSAISFTSPSNAYSDTNNNSIIIWQRYLTKKKKITRMAL